jgi:hypothetical protein
MEHWTAGCIGRLSKTVGAIGIRILDSGLRNRELVGKPEPYCLIEGKRCRVEGFKILHPESLFLNPT